MLSFVVQDRHDRTHQFDFRLEKDGVFNSSVVSKLLKGLAEEAAEGTASGRERLGLAMDNEMPPPASNFGFCDNHSRGNARGCLHGKSHKVSRISGGSASFTI